MSVVPIHREWMEVWSGTPKGEDAVRWFVEHCTADGKLVVADYPNEVEALAEARIWGLPLVRDRA